jgi:hypothetical protein
MEMAMNKNYRNATQQLHKFVSGDADLSDAEVRESLKAEGVNIENFLARLKSEAEIPAEQPKVQQPTASEKLRALASRAGKGVKKLLGNDAIDDVGAAVPAFGRSGKSRPSTKKANRNTKRRK